MCCINVFSNLIGTVMYRTILKNQGWPSSLVQLYKACQTLITQWKILHITRSLKLMSDVASFAREKRQTQTTLKTHQFKAINKLITTTSERCGYGESEWEHLNGRLHGSSANELLKTEFLITKTVTKMSPMDMLSTEQGLDLRKGQVRETLRPYSRRRKDPLLHVIWHWLHVVQLPKGTSENSVTKNTNVYSARTIQVVNFMMYHLKIWGPISKPLY